MRLWLVAYDDPGHGYSLLQVRANDAMHARQVATRMLWGTLAWSCGLRIRSITPA